MKDKINWDEVRVQAAIAMAPRCHELAQDVLMRGGAVTPNKTLSEYVAVNAVIYADELVKELQKGQATDCYNYYNVGYRDAIDKVRDAFVSFTDTIDRMNAVKSVLQEEYVR